MPANYPGKLFVALVALLTISSVARGHNFSYSGSIQYSTGNYIFTDRTHSFFLYNGLNYQNGALTLSANIPLIWQNSSLISNSGVGMIPSGGDQSEAIKQAIKHGRITLPDTSDYSSIGVGDPMLYVYYEIQKEHGNLPSVSINGGIKIPIATSSSGFGTGEWDYGFGASLSRTIDTWMFLVDGSYWFLGNPPGFELQDSFMYSLSVGRYFPQSQIGLLGSFSGTTNTNTDIDPVMSIGLGLNYSISLDQSISSTLNFGLTDATPDFALSFGWRFGL